MSRRSPRVRVEGGLLITALATVAVTALVGTGVGLTVVIQGGGCTDAYTGDETSQAELERCRGALPRQLEVAAAGANFIPSGANETLATQLIAAGVDQASQPPATDDADLPPSVQFAAEGYPGMNHCRIDGHSLYPYATGICYSGSGDLGSQIPTECGSEGGSSGSGPCPAAAQTGACLRETSSGGFAQWVEYGIGAGDAARARGNCGGDYAFPYQR